MVYSALGAAQVSFAHQDIIQTEKYYGIVPIVSTLEMQNAAQCISFKSL